MPGSVRGVAAIVIGRNEGARLIKCLESVQGAAARIIYVDSGSTDGSQRAAVSMGAELVDLRMDRPFTAARARNAGLEKLSKDLGEVAYVQFIDGDCKLHPDWIEAGRSFLTDHPDVVAVAGNLRETHPDASIYNRLCADEWHVPAGEARACGGIVMMRVDPLLQAGGFREDLIAGEEPELCVRLRRVGGKIWRLDTEMASHDAAMTHFGQWWQRTRRGGYAFAEGVALHGAPPEWHCVPELRRVVLWGIILPLMTVLGVLASPWALLLLLAWPAQVVRLRWRGMPWYRALFLTLTKLPEAQGALTYWWRKVTGRRARLIEYK
jgi:glycosyltransferase involved in cell wall biosynthesis